MAGRIKRGLHGWPVAILSKAFMFLYKCPGLSIGSWFSGLLPIFLTLSRYEREWKESKAIGEAGAGQKVVGQGPASHLEEVGGGVFSRVNAEDKQERDFPSQPQMDIFLSCPGWAFMSFRGGACGSEERTRASPNAVHTMTPSPESFLDLPVDKSTGPWAH